MSSAAGLLSGAHAFVALTRREQHWLLPEAEAKVYGQALANAVRHLKVEVAQKAVDFGTLALVALTYETPRVLRSVQLGQERLRRGPVPPGGAQVFRFTPRGGPAPGAPPPGAGHQPGSGAAAQAQAPPAGPSPDFSMEFEPPPDFGA